MKLLLWYFLAVQFFLLSINVFVYADDPPPPDNYVWDGVSTKGYPPMIPDVDHSCDRNKVWLEAAASSTCYWKLVRYTSYEPFSCAQLLNPPDPVSGSTNTFPPKPPGTFDYQISNPVQTMQVHLADNVDVVCPDSASSSGSVYMCFLYYVDANYCTNKPQNSGGMSDPPALVVPDLACDETSTAYYPCWIDQDNFVSGAYYCVGGQWSACESFGNVTLTCTPPHIARACPDDDPFQGSPRDDACFMYGIQTCETGTNGLMDWAACHCPDESGYKCRDCDRVLYNFEESCPVVFEGFSRWGEGYIQCLHDIWSAPSCTSVLCPRGSTCYGLGEHWNGEKAGCTGGAAYYTCLSSGWDDGTCSGS